MTTTFRFFSLLVALSALLTFNACEQGGGDAKGGASKNDSLKVNAKKDEKSSAAANESDAPKDTLVKFDETSFDFGKIKIGSPKSHTFTFTNTSNQPVIIKDVKPGCSCTKGKYTETVVPVGKTGTVELTYKNTDATKFSKSSNVFIESEPAGKRQVVMLKFSGEGVK